MDISVMKKLALTTSQLTNKQSEKTLTVKSRGKSNKSPGILDQKRAITAFEFGLAVKNPSYNIYAMGESGTGRTAYIRYYLEEKAKNIKSSNDWVYVNNFDQPRRPRAISLPAGKGSVLKEDFNTLINSLLDTFPTVFENLAYQQQKSEIEHQFNKTYDQVIDRIEQKALKHNIALFRESSSLTFVPMKKGKTMEETEFARLPDKERIRFNNHITALEAMLSSELAEMPQWKRNSRELLRKLNYKTIDKAIIPLITPLKNKYKEHKALLDFFDTLAKDLHVAIMEHLADERGLEFREDANKRNYLKERYIPNVIVENKKNDVAPVIFENHPTYRNLFGRVEYTTEMGSLVTNYSQICAGSLHRANGGFLVLEAAKLLEEPFTWEALKRALKDKQLTIEPPPSELNFINTVSLSPEIIPLDVKIILIGSRQIYYLLQEHDHDFHQLFSILADFDSHIKRTPEHIKTFIHSLQNWAESQNIPPITASAFARLIEHSSRLAEHKEELTAHVDDIYNLIREADYLRSKTRNRKINHQHIQAALKSREERTNRISRAILKDIVENNILIDTKGQQTGKINGLTVLSVGDTCFGSPARITATVYAGSHGIVDIEREVQLGQAIHSKGVMILTGYLGNKYTQEFVMNVSANIALEQSYGYVDGDSASLAELCCLISALTKLPIDQGIAVTGSINQYGEVQAVGGVNEKIEGFFDLCNTRKLTGQQGVIIPKANINNLMLDDRVIDAVEKGKFIVYAVEEVDQAIEILMKNSSGKQDKKGKYPKDSINYLVMQRLKTISEMNKDTDNQE
ncbi:MAG: ATP-binding protein [Endozoicomonadaceae bacterium]|nr:ATP-binding protein [Endozoicomonadaceae bacterium]MCY4328520.1 ATP-binding protein [Endozoicomonadaceae bacterium]